MKKFSELPVKIQKRMLEAQVEQGNKANPSIFEENIQKPRAGGGFNWCETKEGLEAWDYALDGDGYAFLYEINPELKPDSEEDKL